MYCNDENEVESELNKVQGKGTENQFTVKKDPERGPFLIFILRALYPFSKISHF